MKKAVKEYLGGCRIIQDTREQQPFTFNREVVVRKLDVGDYSIIGPDGRDFSQHDICIERKDDDLWGSCFQDHDRFRKELIRARDRLMFFCLVVEKPLASFLDSGMSNAEYILQIATMLNVWAIKYNLHLRFCNNKDAAARVTEEFLLKYVEHFLRDSKKEVTVI